jgi:hypothetical protein
MTVLKEIAYFQNRRDEVPNQQLAKKLADNRDSAGIKEIAQQLWDKVPNVRSDCLKVLYEIGYVAPELIADYAGDFIRLTQDKSNRMVWGGMIALSTVAFLRPDLCLEHLDEIMDAIESGSVITQDAGVAVLAGIASAGSKYSTKTFPILMDQLTSCAPKYLANRAEHSLPAINKDNAVEFTSLLERRLPELPSSLAKRVRKLINLFR